MAAVAEARWRGADVTCETCPHYLALTEDDLERLGTLAKCAPPLRTAAERDALWEQLARGRIALVASDHSPCPPAMKAGGFGAAWGGIAGAQATLTVLLHEGAARAGCRSRALAELVTGAPARRFRLPKGRLEPGADADLALVDLRGEHAARAAATATARTRSPAARCAPAWCARCCAAAPSTRTAASRPARTAAC